MTALRKIRVIKTMAAEGNFHAYKLLRNGGRFFLFLKYLKATLEYWIGSRKSAHDFAPSIAYIKGGNQLRHFYETRTLIESRIGSVVPYSGTNLAPSMRRLAMVATQDVLGQILCLFLLLLTGRRRHLNMYYVAFYEGVRRSVHQGDFTKVSNFICFNDQPYDVAALVLAFRGIPECNTAVLQHGLILSPHFYFPTHVHEFWGWGAASAYAFCGSFPDTSFVITGRSIDDACAKSPNFVEWPPSDEITFVLAPSHRHGEIKALLRSVTDAAKVRSGASFLMKLHPATKFKAFVRLWIKTRASWAQVTDVPIGQLSGTCDALITVNSTSGIDFLLRGKPVFFSTVNDSDKYPSAQYGLQLNEIASYARRTAPSPKELNPGRLRFIREYMNV